MGHALRMRHAVARAAEWRPEAAVVAMVRPENGASRAVAERAGVSLYDETTDEYGTQLRMRRSGVPADGRFTAGSPGSVGG